MLCFFVSTKIKHVSSNLKHFLIFFFENSDLKSSRGNINTEYQSKVINSDINQKVLSRELNVFQHLFLNETKQPKYWLTSWKFLHS